MGCRVVVFLAALGIVHGNLLNSCSITQGFVNGHNQRRLNLANGVVPGQPAASHMKYIIWDDEIAAKAQNWASRNRFEHNPDKTVPSGRFTVGENIYKYSTTDNNFSFDPEMAMSSWWDEYQDYTFRDMNWNDFNGAHQIGHYTQMAWSDSVRFGCGVSQYHENGWNNFFVVCNYGPPGNYMGQTPYKTGSPSGQLVCGVSDCSRRYGDYC